MITFKNIPESLDGDKDIIVGGEVIGVVYRGWLRHGGEQWVAQLEDTPAIGAKTLTEMKLILSYKITK